MNIKFFKFKLLLKFIYILLILPSVAISQSSFRGTNWGMSLEKVSEIEGVEVNKKTTDYLDNGNIDYGFMTTLPINPREKLVCQINYLFKKNFGLFKSLYTFLDLELDQIKNLRKILKDKYGNKTNVYYGNPKFTDVFKANQSNNIFSLLEEGYSTRIVYSKFNNTIVSFTIIKHTKMEHKLWGYIEYFEKEYYMNNKYPELKKRLNKTSNKF